MSTPPTAPTSHAKHAARPRRPLRRAQCHPEGLRVWRPQLTLHPPRVSISWQSRGVHAGGAPRVPSERLGRQGRLSRDPARLRVRHQV